jgi:hypothetical protein
MLGEYFGLMKMRMVKSIRKAITKICVRRKFPISQEFRNDTSAKKNRMPAAARTSRSFNTGTS